ncbi:MAG TPA: CoA pyrophosphatase [Kofleriaceae bacterium]|nr:CoA pyrophosphatase [Kofleriaceae bacterium]
MDRLSRERIATIVGAHRAKDPLLAVPGRRAAVAAIIRFDRVQPEILLMQRAERDGDRWSGHVSMPGGNFDPRDEDLRATAIRETREEVGLDLAECAQGLGRLDAIQAVARGKILPMTITPFVFALVEDRPLALGPEAAAAFWLPLEDAARGALDGTYEWKLGPVPMSLPCWNYDGRVVWGLTYKMLGALLELVREAPEPLTTG